MSADCGGLCALLAAATDDRGRILVAELLVREAYAQLAQVGEIAGRDSVPTVRAQLGFLVGNGLPAVAAERGIQV